MKRDWRSSKPGQIFTHSPSWEVALDVDRLVIKVEQDRPQTFHLVQIHTLSVTPGLMWATCRLEIQTGQGKLELSFDGIPNDKALQMQRVVVEATVKALASFVSGSAQALETWVEQAFGRLDRSTGRMIGLREIHGALAAGRAPPTPGDVPWDSILGHQQADAARVQARAWPSWITSPADALAARVESHNKLTFKKALEQWYSGFMTEVDMDRWIPKSKARRILENHPAPKWPGRSWKQLTGVDSPEASLLKYFQESNARHAVRQRVTRRRFFETVEKNPLTEEQINACICMDEAVMVVAAAGSGKTSTMVAKTGYVLHEGLANVDQVLLLAFNRATADELGQRLAEQLRDVPNVERVKSKTFHSFGIEVISKASGRAPSLAPWVDPTRRGGDIEATCEIIEFLKARDATFRRDWDLFRLVYGRDVGKWGRAQEPEAFGDGKRGFRTANNEIVRSKEELAIANWLFYCGVKYEYERRYEHDTATEHRRQYSPDFYYPDADLYHEHFALDARGNPPERFKDYLDGVRWKREIHQIKGTALVETTSYLLRSGRWEQVLTRALVERGVQPNFDPTRPCPGQPPISEQDLARTFRVFQQHVKNNGLGRQQLGASLNAQSKEGFGARLAMFLSLYERIAAEWEGRLKGGGYVDFEDMLIQAAEHVESGAYQSPYKIILADEFQDSSRARVRLLKALATKSPSQTHLCVVGDDWQGINRFAGSDISVMTEFESVFAHATRLTLNTTFRCPKDVCDVSSAFVQANPAQIRKTVTTTNPLTKTPLLAYGLQSIEGIVSLLERQLSHMHKLAGERKVLPERGSHITVMLLGRYGNDRPSGLDGWKQQFGDLLKIDFRTVHGSKGLEAEYVFVLNVVEGVRGFPSQIQDDPILQLAMPVPEDFPFAEERRLFYVAMTRARKQVRFFTSLQHPSQFLVELVSKGMLVIEPVGGVPLQPCPRCSAGVLRLRNGGNGAFFGCSRFPACDYTAAADQPSVEPPSAANGLSRLPAGTAAGERCPVCRRGTIQVKTGRNGPFLGCTRFREGCRATGNMRPLGAGSQAQTRVRRY